MSRYLFMAAVLTLSSTPLLQGQQRRYNHPELEWRTITTEHFTVTYHDGVERSAKRVAKIAEEIYEPVTFLYDHQPDNPVRFIVQDTDDISNGAAYFYENKIIIWALPMDYDLRGTHNWLRDVVTHEFTHIVSMQAAMRFKRNLPAFYFQWFTYEDELRNDVVRGFPNGVVSYPYSGLTTPLWFAEGVAQYNTRSLRYDHWDSHRDMLLRERALNGSLLSLDDMAVFGKSGIANESVYNQGYSFVSYLADRFGEQSLNKIARALSSKFPVSISGAIKKATGVRGDKVYDDWKREISRNYDRDTKVIRDNELRGEKISRGGTANLFPEWSPDGKSIVYLSNRGKDYFTQTDLYIYDTKSGGSKKIASAVQSSASWSPDGEKIVYGRIAKPDKRGSTYFDLYQFDIQTEKEKRLTYGSRGRYPVHSPDGKKIAFVSSEDGSSMLMIYDTASGEINELTRFDEIRQVYKLDWSPDGNRLLFETSTGNGRDIATINSDGSGFRLLVNSPADERHPVFSPDGKQIYFASDRTGIYNIYSLDVERGETKQWTNVTGGAFMPSVTQENSLAYSEFSGRGYKLFLLNLKEEVNEENSVYRTGYVDEIPIAEYDQNQVPDYDTDEYERTFSTMFFLPRIMIDYGTVKLGGYFFSSELLDKLSFIGGGAINSNSDFDTFLRFDYNSLTPNIFLEVYGISQNVEDSLVIPGQSTPLDIKFNLIEVSPGMTFFRGEKDNFTFRFRFSLYSATQIGFPKLDDGTFGKFSFGYDYFIGRAFSLEWMRESVFRSSKGYIARDKGMSWNLSYSYKLDKFITGFARNKDFGTFEEVYDPFNYHQIDVRIDKYFGMPAKSALALNIDAGYISDSVVDFLYYFGGGLLGMKGYSYYSIGGERKLIGTTTLKVPVIKDINKTFLNLYFRDLYGGLFFQYGNAWIGDARINEFKRTVGYTIRLGAFSFYAFPTAFEFQGAYGLDKFTGSNGEKRGGEWKYYFTLLFDFL
ncbi:MAG: PD40 domain-containing protein [Candidatus Marinimicrobia bacterium]|nr:PD40 domain-containing protein [Candidatus Neomarinimicrobiota bacterium]